MPRALLPGDGVTFRYQNKQNAGVVISVTSKIVKVFNGERLHVLSPNSRNLSIVEQPDEDVRKQNLKEAESKYKEHLCRFPIWVERFEKGYRLDWAEAS